jgi:hypothetical protein
LFESSAKFDIFEKIISLKKEIDVSLLNEENLQ